MGSNAKALRGHIIYAPTSKELISKENGYIVYEGENIVGVYDELPAEYKDCAVEDYGSKVIIPGLVDLHVHAPQFAVRGVGLDMELLDWLNTYIFCTESKFADPAYARMVYRKVAQDFVKQGTTRIVIFGTIHNAATEILMDEFAKVGVTAYVGKVNMDRNSPDYLIEKTDDSVKDTIKFIEETVNKYPHIKPIVTPRFVPSCTPELMAELGKIARKYDLPVQSHLSENHGEIAWVHELEPECKYYLDAYKKYDLFGNGLNTVMAHCVHMSDDEIKAMKDCGVYVAHCPESNNNLSSGISPIRKLMDAGVHVGLGSDVSGGYELSILKVMCEAIQVSKLKWESEGREGSFLTVLEAFYLGTTGGAEYFGHKGGFGAGDPLHALVIDDTDLKYDKTLKDTPEERIERIIHLADDRNIVARYANGKNI